MHGGVERVAAHRADQRDVAAEREVDHVGAVRARVVDALRDRVGAPAAVVVEHPHRQDRRARRHALDADPVPADGADDPAHVGAVAVAVLRRRVVLHEVVARPERARPGPGGRPARPSPRRPPPRRRRWRPGARRRPRSGRGSTARLGAGRPRSRARRREEQQQHGSEQSAHRERSYPETLYAITYVRMEVATHVGSRVRALREGMDLSPARPRRAQRRLRADALPGRARRDEPDAARSPAASPPASSCASRSCCASTRAAPSRSCAPRTAARGGADGHRYEIAHPAAARPARRGLHATRSQPGAPHRRPRRPADARARRARDQRSSSAGTLDLRRRRRRATSSHTGDAVTFDADLPHHFENHGRGGGRPARGRVGGAAPLMTPTTLFDKIWAAHEVAHGPALHRPPPRPRGHQPAGLRRPAARRPQGPPARPHARHRRPQRARPTARRSPRASTTSSVAPQVETLERNCEEFGIPLYSLGSDRQGIVHVIGPELGVTQPGMTIVCGDSHTATHGAFGALAFGIGTSEVEHVLATQTLAQRKPKSMRIHYDGRARLRRHRQGPDPRHDRPDGHQRRRRPRRRVRRPGRSRRSRWRAG